MSEALPSRPFGVGVILLAVQFTASLAAVAWIKFLPISTPHCGPRCDYAALDAVQQTFPNGTIAVFVIAVAAVIALRRRRWVFAVPLAALLLLVGGTIIATDVSNRAVLF